MNEPTVPQAGPVHRLAPVIETISTDGTWLDTLSHDDRTAQAEFRFWPEGYASLQALGQLVKASELEPGLIGLVKMRASQIDGCAYCIDMHSRDARMRGESEQRLYALSAWREAPFFTRRERAALALAESVTLIAQGGLSSDIVDEASSVFAPDELTRLLYLIIEINAWNRLAITTGTPERGVICPPDW